MSLKRNYFKSTNKIFYSGLDSRTIAVYCFMSSCSEEFNPSVRYISKTLGISKSTVSKAIHTLCERHIISQMKGATKGHSAEYEFVNPVFWKKV